MCSPSEIRKYGAKPANIQWSVVRGDTAVLKVDFFEPNETDMWDTTGWIYKATSYDPQGNILDNLEVQSGEGYATIIADACLTERWGTGYNNVVVELKFDLQITIPESNPNNTIGQDIIWTPVIGTIVVLGDVTPGGL
jgi:hypothetical protein